jgi:SHS family lactate transporter-like MFS transporter
MQISTPIDGHRRISARRSPPSAHAPLCERFPIEVRATASAFCYHQGAIFGGLVAPVLTYVAANYGVGLGVSMLAGTVVGAVSNICALLLSPETKGKVLAADLVLA